MDLIQLFSKILNYPGQNKTYRDIVVHFEKTGQSYEKQAFEELVKVKNGTNNSNIVEKP